MRGRTPHFFKWDPSPLFKTLENMHTKEYTTLDNNIRVKRPELSIYNAATIFATQEKDAR